MTRHLLKLALIALTLTACNAKPEKPRIVWIEAGASSEYYFESQENIFRDCKRIKEAGFTDVVVDVRPTSGDVLFKSSAAPASSSSARRTLRT